MINIAVCDDDVNYLKLTLRKYIVAALKKSGIIANVVFYSDGKNLLNDFNNHKLYDIVILDVDMPGIDGKKLAENLRIIDSKFFLVFVTIYNAEIYNTIAYRINAFISKESTDKIFISELSRVFNEYSIYKPEYDIFEAVVNDQKETIKVLINDIFYFYCVKRTCYLVTGKEEITLASHKFVDFAEKYCKTGFFEICRGYIVNISKVKSVKYNEVILDNDVKLPLSRGRNKKLLEQISDYLKERTEC